MVHVVDIGRADRGGQWLDQQFARAGHRIGGLPDLQSAVAQHHRPHQPAVPCLLAESTDAALMSSTSVRRSEVQIMDAMVRLLSPTG